MDYGQAEKVIAEKIVNGNLVKAIIYVRDRMAYEAQS